MSSINDITGDKISTKITTDNYRSNYDKIFRKDKKSFSQKLIDNYIEENSIIKEVIQELADNTIDENSKNNEPNNDVSEMLANDSGGFFDKKYTPDSDFYNEMQRRAFNPVDSISNTNNENNNNVSKFILEEDQNRNVKDVIKEWKERVYLPINSIQLNPIPNVANEHIKNITI